MSDAIATTSQVQPATPVSPTPDSGIVYNSIAAGSFEDRKVIAAAVLGATSISEVLGKTINLKNVIVQKSEMTDNRTGELTTVPRTLLIADDGSAYYGFGVPLYRDVESVISVMGAPGTWPTALPVVVSQEGKAPSKYFTLNLA
jgi:hypothetical protein